MQPAIILDRLSKQYTIGQMAHEDMLREVIVNTLRRPFRRSPKTEESIWALKDVSFSVENGEVVGIIGRNGAGKSTLLKILSKIAYPTSGSIEVRGRVAALLEVGTGFHEELTGRENIYLNGSILGMKKREIDARLDEIIDFAGIGRFLDTPIKRYSSGMRLRLGFAVAAHLQTDVLLVDEVLAVGDVEFQKKCLSKIENLHHGGRTVIFVSHNMAAIELLCPRTLWIHDGRVRTDGETDEVVRAYLAHFSDTEAGGANLLAIREREGTGEVRLSGIEILDADGMPTPVVRCGDAMKARISYRASTELRNAQFGIGLTTERGIRIAMVSTVDTGYQIPILPAGEGYVDVTFDFLNLMPGRYWITLWATGPKHYNSVKHTWDTLENCASFDVEPSDFYKSGTGLITRLGLVLFPCRWMLGNTAAHGNGRAGAASEDRDYGCTSEVVPPEREGRQ